MMQMSKLFNVVFMFFCLSYFSVFSVFAAEKLEREENVTAFSLQEVCDYALKHSTSTENARLDVAIARKKIWETTATGLPQISASVSYTNNLKIPTTLIPAQFLDPDEEEGTFIGVKFGTQHNASVDLTLNQLIFSGSYIVGLQASKIYLRLSQEQLIKSEINIKESVTKTYYLILLAEENKRTLTVNLENLRKILYETTELYKAGFSEDTDVDQLQLSVTDMENAVKSIERQIKITYRLLKYQMGFDLDKEIRLSQTLEDFLAEIDKGEILEDTFDLNKHIDFRILDTQAKSLKLLLRNEQAAYLPTISAFFTYSQNAMRDSFNFFSKEKWFPAIMVGINVNIPIFSSGMRGARVAQARMELRKTTNLKKEVEDGLKLELLQARSEFSDARENSRNTRANVKLAKKIYDKTLVKYSSGTVSSLELIQTHNQYLGAESKYITAIVELLNAKVRLDKVLNQL